MENRIKLDVSGQTFSITQEQLNRGPPSKLVSLCKEATSTMIIGRPSDSFAAVLSLYQTGELHIPASLCPVSLLNELEFWNISPMLISKCCINRLESFLDEQEMVRDFRKYQKEKRPIVPVLFCDKASSFRAKMWTVVEYNKPTVLATIYSSVSLLMILASILTLAYSTDPNFSRDMTSCENIEYLLATDTNITDQTKDNMKMFCSGNSNHTATLTEKQDKEGVRILLFNFESLSDPLSVKWTHSESSTTWSTPFGKNNTAWITPASENNTTRSTPASENKTTWNTPAGENNTTWSTPDGENNTTWSTPDGESNTIWITAAGESNTTWSTPVSESNTTWSTPASENNITWITAAGENNTTWSTPAGENNTTWSTPASENNITWITLLLKADLKTTTYAKEAVLLSLHSLEREIPQIKIKVYSLVVCGFVTTVFFTLDFVFRIISCPCIVRYFTSIINIVDALALASTYLHMLLIFLYRYEQYNNTWLNVLEYSQMTRAFRLFRAIANVRAGKILSYTILKNGKDLLIIALFLIAGMCIYASCFYLSEDHKDVPTLPDAWYWAIVTMTTVGYGDMVPKTFFGRMFASLCAVTGILLMALTVPIFSHSFMTLYNHVDSLDTEKKIQRWKEYTLEDHSDIKTVSTNGKDFSSKLFKC